MMADPAEELDAWLADDDGGDLDEPPELETREQVDWLLRRLGRLDRRAAADETAAADAHTKINEWLQARAGIVDRQRRFIVRSLENWMRDHHRSTRAKTVVLPGGELWLRAGGRRVGDRPIVDAADAAALETLVPGLVRTTWALDRRAAVAMLTAGPPFAPGGDDGYTAHRAVNDDGEPVPGVTLLVPTADTFTARPTPPSPTPTDP